MADAPKHPSESGTAGYMLCAASRSAFFDPFSLHARLDFDVRDRTRFPVLLHEYTHYLQSVSTVYGIYRVLDWIRTAVRLESVLPALDLIRMPALDWWKEDSCPPRLRAQMTEIAERLRFNTDLEQMEILEDVELHDVGPVTVATILFTADEEEHNVVVWEEEGLLVPVGARALSEGMAASVQRIWQEESSIDTDLAALPADPRGWYKATREVLARCAPGAEDLDALNITVCDLALMTRNPPAAFFAAAVTVAAAERDHAAAVRETLSDLVAEEMADTRADLSATLERLRTVPDEPLARAVIRLLEIADALLGRRASEPDWLPRLFHPEHRGIRAVIADFPLPIYFRDRALMSWHEDETLELIGRQLLMLEHALRMILFGPEKGTECPLAASTSCESPRTPDCYHSPWLVTADAANTVCAFGDALASLGIFGKRFETRE